MTDTGAGGGLRRCGGEGFDVGRHVPGDVFVEQLFDVPGVVGFDHVGAQGGRRRKAAAIPAQVFAHARETGHVVEPFKRMDVLQDHVEPVFP